MNILIVEDNEMKRNLIKETISKCNGKIDIDSCTNTMSAKENLVNKDYDILILDLNLPIFDGDDSTDESGIMLYEEIDRSKMYKKPQEIIIVTAHQELKEKYADKIEKGLLSIIIYDSSLELWKEQLTNRINYLIGSNFQDDKGEKLLFISHSCLDIEYVKVLVELLKKIGFKDDKKLFCSSLTGYNIPVGNNIYDYLKKQFEKNLHVICLLSDNYYRSPACMNEMGAAWVKTEKQTAILVLEFNYSQIRGAIDASNLWIKMNEKERINELKEKLIEEFDLQSAQINSSLWMSELDEYIKQVNDIYEKNKYKITDEQVLLEEFIEDDTETNVTCIFRFINNSDEAKRCKKISLTLEDNKKEKISFEINYNRLKEYTIYKKENKCISIMIKKEDIEGIDKFDIYEWKNPEIRCSWTNSFTI